MSPLVWDLAHIAAYEDLWLVHRHGGEPLLQPGARRDVRRVRDAARRPRRPAAARPRARRSTTSPRCARARWRCSTATAPATSTRWCSATSTSTARRCCRRSSSPGCRPRPAVPRRAAPRRAAAATPGSRPSTSPPGRARSARRTSASPTTTSARATAPSCPRFRIGRTPITNATFLTLRRGRRLPAPRVVVATRAGRGRRTTTSPTREGWAAGPDGWRQWRIDGWAPLRPRRARGPRLLVRGRRLRQSPRRPAPDRGRVGEGGDLGPGAGTALPYPWGDEPPNRAAPTSTTACSARTRRRAPDGAAPCGALGHARRRRGSGPRASSAATPASPPTPTASTPRSSSAAATRCCAAARGPRARACRRRRSATGTSPSGARSSPGVRLAWDA